MLDRAFRDVQGDDGPADADHRRQPHRLRRAAQAGHHAAHGEPLGEEEIRLDQAVLRLARGREVPVPDGVYEHFADGHRRARREGCATPGSTRFEAYKAKYPELADELDRMQHRQLPDGWDKDLPTFPRRRQGHRRPRRVGQGAQRARQERPLADRRLGRPRPVDQDAPHLRRRRRLRGRTTTAGATSTSASASTRWARSSTAWRSSRSARSARAS